MAVQTHTWRRFLLVIVLIVIGAVVFVAGFITCKWWWTVLGMFFGMSSMAFGIVVGFSYYFNDHVNVRKK